MCGGVFRGGEGKKRVADLAVILSIFGKKVVL